MLDLGKRFLFKFLHANGLQSVLQGMCCMYSAEPVFLRGTQVLESIPD